MKTDEIKKIIKWIGGLFSAVTQEQASLLYQELKQFDYETVSHVVREHRKGNEFINFPALLKACRAKEHENDNRTRSMPDQSFAQVIRNQWPDLRDKCDVEVVLRFWRADWHRYKTEADKRFMAFHDGAKDQKARHLQNESGYRSKVLIGCAGGLVDIGLLADVAESYAKIVIDPDVMYFRQSLEEVRDKFPVQPRAQMTA